MRIGLGNKITSFFGRGHTLLLPKYRNRNPRAIEFQKALVRDILDNSKGLNNSLNHFSHLAFSQTTFLKEFIGLVKAVHCEDTPEKEVIHLLSKWSKSKQKLTSGQWLELSMYLLSMGFFQSSYQCRLGSYENFEGIKNNIIYQLNYKQLLTSLYFDGGQLQNAEIALDKLSSGNLYWNAFFGRLDEEKRQALNPGFYSLIHNKRVAVIGPLEFDQDYRDEIAEYDVVVELNALESKREGVIKKYHGKPDIVYYNNSRLGELKKIHFDDIVHTAKYIVLKTPKHREALDAKLPTRAMPSTTTLNWNGSFSMMENTVADLLLFQPAEIKIYGVNLYTSFNYDKSYGNAPPDNLKRITLNFTVHDIYTQYAFMNNMFNMGLIKGDHTFNAVLKLGVNGYVNRMQELYPKFLLNYSN